MAIAFVRQGNGGGSAVNPLLVTITAPNPGNALVAEIYNNTSAVTSITGGGVTWAKAVRESFFNGAEIWYGTNSTGVGTTITINYAGAQSRSDANITEWSGMAAVPLDQTSVGHSVSGSPSTSIATVALTPLQDGELVIALGAFIPASGSLSAGPTNGFNPLTQLGTAANGIVTSAYLIQTAAAAASTAWTWTVATNSDTAMASFMAAPTAFSEDFAVSNFDTRTGGRWFPYQAAMSAPEDWVQRIVLPINSVQAKAFSNNTGLAPFVSNVTAGNLLIVAVGIGSNTVPPSTITDTLGNTYLLAVQQAHPTLGVSCFIHYCISKASGANTVTVSNASTGIDIHILEYSGLLPAQSAVLDAVSSGTTTSGNSATAATISTSTPIQLLFAFTDGGGTGATAGGSYTLRLNTVSQGYSEDHIVTSLTTEGASMTFAINDTFVIVMATFSASLPPTVAVAVSDVDHIASSRIQADGRNWAAPPAAQQFDEQSNWIQRIFLPVAGNTSFGIAPPFGYELDSQQAHLPGLGGRGWPPPTDALTPFEDDRWIQFVMLPVRNATYGIAPPFDEVDTNQKPLPPWFDSDSASEDVALVTQAITGTAAATLPSLAVSAAGKELTVVVTDLDNEHAQHSGLAWKWQEIMGEVFIGFFSATAAVTLKPLAVNDTGAELIPFISDNDSDQAHTLLGGRQFAAYKSAQDILGEVILAYFAGIEAATLRPLAVSASGNSLLPFISDLDNDQAHTVLGGRNFTVCRAAQQPFEDDRWTQNVILPVPNGGAGIAPPFDEPYAHQVRSPQSFHQDDSSDPVFLIVGGNGSITLPHPLSVSSSGTLNEAGTAAVTLKSLAASANGAFTLPFVFVVTDLDNQQAHAALGGRHFPTTAAALQPFEDDRWTQFVILPVRNATNGIAPPFDGDFEAHQQRRFRQTARLDEPIVDIAVPAYYGAIAATLKHLTASATGTEIGIDGQIVASLKSLAASLTGTVGEKGTAAVTLKHVTVFGQTADEGTLNTTLSAVKVSGLGTFTGIPNETGVAATTLRPLSAHLVGTLNEIGTGAITLGRLVVAGNNKIKVSIDVSIATAHDVSVSAATFHDTDTTIKVN